MNYRQAIAADVPEMHMLRMSVKENMLLTPSLVNEKDYHEMLQAKGNGWVCENNDKILGFAMIDLSAANVWALFVKPGFEGQGIGRQLFRTMIDWGFAQGLQCIWLTTDPATRAYNFYTKAGMTDTARLANGEARFEISCSAWNY